jgi:hypothetical protein
VVVHCVQGHLRSRRGTRSHSQYTQEWPPLPPCLHIHNDGMIEGSTKKLPLA